MTLQGIIAKKVGMTRMVDEEGQMIPVTLLQVAEQGLTKVLTEDKNGYNAIQLGYYPKPEPRLNKPDLTRLRKANIKENYTRFTEFRSVKPVEGLDENTKFTVELLNGVPVVDVTGLSKGRGFKGAITRWNHQAGRMSHGSRFHRRPGSLGCRTTPGRVFKNKHMPGHWGDERCTVRNLQVMDIDTAANVVAIKGSVPGYKNGFVFIRPSTKAAKQATKEKN